MNIGQGNFDVIRIDFFQEREAAFQAFQKGLITYREEFTSLTWATGYNFPAATEGRVKKTKFPAEAIPDFQYFFYNTRSGKFADPRTRLAIGLAFDFEWSNKNLFFDAYDREVLLFPELGLHGRGQAGRGRVEAARAHTRQTCRRRCSTRPMCRRRPTVRATTARC